MFRKMSSTGSDKMSRAWTEEEDEQLRQAVREIGPQKWRDIAEYVPTRTHTQCLQRWNKVLKPGLKKGPWDDQETVLLKGLVEHFLANSDVSQVDWALIAEQIEGRSVKQCRERWRHNLDPSVKKGPWTKEEDEVLLREQHEKGNCWSHIARLLPGRTEHTVKTRFRSLARMKKRAWTQEQDDLLVQQYRKHGSDPAYIAESLGKTKKCVVARMKELNLWVKGGGGDNKDKMRPKFSNISQPQQYQVMAENPAIVGPHREMKVEEKMHNAINMLLQNDNVSDGKEDVFCKAPPSVHAPGHYLPMYHTEAPCAVADQPDSAPPRRMLRKFNTNESLCSIPSIIQETLGNLKRAPPKRYNSVTEMFFPTDAESLAKNISPDRSNKRQRLEVSAEGGRQYGLKRYSSIESTVSSIPWANLLQKVEPH